MKYTNSNRCMQNLLKQRHQLGMERSLWVDVGRTEYKVELSNKGETGFRKTDSLDGQNGKSK